MPRIFESWCGDAYGMVKKMLDTSVRTVSAQ